MTTPEAPPDLPVLDAPLQVIVELPVVVVVFAASWSGPSISMVGRVTSIVEECGRVAGLACPVVVLDADSSHGLGVARHLDVAVHGWGETSWVVRGRAIARADVLAPDGLLRAQTVELIERARPERPTVRARRR